MWRLRDVKRSSMGTVGAAAAAAFGAIVSFDSCRHGGGGDEMGEELRFYRFCRKY